MHRPIQLLWQQSLESGLGWIAWGGTSQGVARLTFGHPSASLAQNALRMPWGDRSTVDQSPLTNNNAGSSSPSPLPEWYRDAERLLLAYCDGQPADLAQIPLDLPQLTPFAQRVIRALLEVGYGETISYGELAERAGSPRAARAVGTVMSRNAVPLIVPCHRVVGSGGGLGGYSAPRGLAMKEELLAMEQANAIPRKGSRSSRQAALPALSSMG